MATPKKAPAKTAAAIVAAATPNTSATESPVIPADVSATQSAESSQLSTPPAGEPLTSSAPGSSLSDEAEKLPLEGGDEYRVLSPLDHDGKRYEIGDSLTLPDAVARSIPAGVVHRSH